MRYKRNYTDPCGPGTRAWERADDAIDLGRAGKRYDNALRDVKIELTRYGRIDEYPEWHDQIKQRMNDPEYDNGRE